MQYEFSFLNELREAEQRKRAEKRNLPYFDTPRDDNERLLNYQHDWLTFGDSSHSQQARADWDYYATDPRAVTELLKLA